MKRKLLYGKVLLMFFGMHAAKAQTVVTVDASAAWTGYANVFDNGVYQFGSPWGVDALQTIINTANNTLQLYPNYNTYNATDSYWSNGELGNKTFEGNTFIENGALSGQTITFAGEVISNTLAAGYVAEAFIKGLNPATGYSLDLYVHTPLVSGVTFELTAPDVPAGLLVQYGFSVTGLNGNPTYMDANGFATVTAATLAVKSFASASVKVFPNPGSDVVQFQAQETIQEIKMYNLLGQNVLTQQASTTEARVDISALPTGSYIAQLQVSGQPLKVRVQKQ